MNNAVKVIANSDNNYEFIINSRRAAELNLATKKNVFVCFGCKKHYVNIKISINMSYENISMSQKLIDEIHIPLYPIYEIATNKNEIIIGPSIGLLVSEDDNDFTESFLKKMMIYVKKYSKLHGAVIIFALNKVDKANQLIEGYCYNPIENQFDKGIFPYPSAIYRTIGLNDIWKNHFLSNIGDRVFNSQYFSKWKMYQWFSSDAKINAHLPYTILFESTENVFDMLERFKKIYIKPISGLRGRGIIQVSKENGLYTFKHRDKVSNYVKQFGSFSEASEYIQTSLSKGKYLVQQGINLIKYDGRIIDFRCVMQKTQANTWKCNAIISRYGEKGSVVSNISSGGKALSAINMFKDVLFLSRQQSDFLIGEIESFSLQVCNKLDEFGINCGTLGLDIGVDSNQYLWLIEINNRDPDPTIALDINDEQLYYELKTNPLFYAKALAGLKTENI